MEREKNMIMKKEGKCGEGEDGGVEIKKLKTKPQRISDEDGKRK
jgi:hypothetical protein